MGLLSRARRIRTGQADPVRKSLILSGDIEEELAVEEEELNWDDAENADGSGNP